MHAYKMEYFKSLLHDQFVSKPTERLIRILLILIHILLSHLIGFSKIFNPIKDMLVYQGFIQALTDPCLPEVKSELQIEF